MWELIAAFLVGFGLMTWILRSKGVDKIIKRPDHMPLGHAIVLVTRWKWYGMIRRIRWIYLVHFWTMVHRAHVAIMCRLLKRHDWIVFSTDYEHSYTVSALDPFVKRAVIRTQALGCQRCLQSEERKERKRVHSDWSYPERLFAGDKS